MTTNTIAFVACSKSKLSTPAKPARLYSDSTLFNKRRRYAEQVADRYVILSAKHGLLHPQRKTIAPYNKTLSNQSTDERKRWSLGVYRDLQDRDLLGDYNKVVMLAGRDYYQYLTQLIEGDAVEVVIPNKGLQIGETLSNLNNLLDQ